MRIMVVEDQDSIRKLIEALVSGRGHEVVAVGNGAKALELANSNPPDIVLLDLNLPGRYDGFEVCRRIRSDPRTRDALVFIISARDDAASRQEAREAGAQGYYGKPFSPTALLKDIDAARRPRPEGSSPQGPAGPGAQS